MKIKIIYWQFLVYFPQKTKLVFSILSIARSNWFMLLFHCVETTFTKRKFHVIFHKFLGGATPWKH